MSNTRCFEGVTRSDVYQLCDRVAVALRHDPEDGQPYPVCVRHVRGDMVPLDDVCARDEALAELAEFSNEHGLTDTPAKEQP